MFWNKHKEVIAEDLHSNFSGSKSNGYGIYDSKGRFHRRFTAEKAYEKSLMGAENKKQEELDKAFKIIEDAVAEGAINCAFLDESEYDLDLLNEELPKLDYKVAYYNGDRPWMQVSWDKPKSEIDNVAADIEAHVSDIDPDKSYILPMEGTKIDGWSAGLYAIKADNCWWIKRVPVMGDTRDEVTYVKGADILNGPDWVKAIKPVEVKE